MYTPLGVQKEERLQSELHCLGTTGPQQHTVFVDGAAEAAAWEPDAYFDTDATLLKRTFNRPRRGQVGQLEAAAGDPAHASKVSMCAAACPSATHGLHASTEICVCRRGGKRWHCVGSVVIHARVCGRMMGKTLFEGAATSVRVLVCCACIALEKSCAALAGMASAGANAWHARRIQ